MKFEYVNLLIDNGKEIDELGNKIPNFQIIKKVPVRFCDWSVKDIEVLGRLKTSKKCIISKIYFKDCDKIEYKEKTYNIKVLSVENRWVILEVEKWN